MSELVQAVLPDGTVLWVRAEDEEAGPVDTGLQDETLRRLEDLPATLQAITRSIRTGLRNSAPDEFSIEFGIEIAGKSGKLVSVLTEVGGKATLKVNVTWRKKDRNDEPRTTVAPVGPEEPEEPAAPTDPGEGEPAASVPGPSAAPDAEPETG